jgi:thiamine-phosphate pyrophosphorylase
MSSTFLGALGANRIYPLTDRIISGLSHVEQVSLLAQAGATVIQLREKTLPAREFYVAAAAALRVARERGVRIIINDRVDIALALEAQGVHLGQEDISPETARRLLGPEAIIGISTHNLEQARLAAEMPVDYVALGPIFDSTTKGSADSPVGLQGVRLVRQAVGDLPLVAIGGISAGNSQDVLNAGADVLAVIGALWTPNQGVNRIKRLLHGL